jgi:hypothetical protein
VGADGCEATDEDSLAKAMRRKAASNLDTSGNKVSNGKSFLAFSTPHISAKLNNVGVSLGNTFDLVSVSAKALKHMEFDRINALLCQRASRIPLIQVMMMMMRTPFRMASFSHTL